MNTYFANELYPLQDKVLATIDQIKTPFYLTGGTALSRCYFHHRHSEDLDLFVNQREDFADQLDRILISLKLYNLQINQRSKTYYSLQVENILKLDLVNDVASRVGEITPHDIFSRIDSIDNILANKISALISRDEPKDIADVWIIAKHKEINWEKLFRDVSSKAAGIFPPIIAQRIESFPRELIEKINWVEDKVPNRQQFDTDLKKIVVDILKIEL